MAPGVHARYNHDAIVEDSEKERIWETREKGTTGVAVDYRERLGPFGNGGMDGGEDMQEFIA